jgi:pimeloyl-ACP methyl ester carboxylesterase
MQISANGVSLEVEDHGPTSGEPLVLIMGLGMQLVAWHEGFVAQLVAQGFRVIRFDNRDIGLSQRFDQFGVPNLAFDAMRHTVGLPVRSPYTIADMADDTAALLDALGLRSAHVCGASMGGMIAQHLAVRHPQRVRSLTLMMTTSGARNLAQPRWKVQLAMLSRPKNPREVESVIEHYVRIYKLIGSPGYPATDAYLHERLGLSVRRSHRPAAVARQLVAIAADGDRSALLPRIQAPVQVIHGLADPLVPVEAGRDLAARISGSEIDLIEGMGHDIPQPLWPRFVADIRSAAARA